MSPVLVTPVSLASDARVTSGSAIDSISRWAFIQPAFVDHCQQPNVAQVVDRSDYLPPR